jgi:branched-chain amino acid transport system substrate-binding protein
MNRKWVRAAAAAAALVVSAGAQAELKIGSVLSLTGPAASLGIPEKNTIEILPKTLAGEPVRFIILDDASEPANAVRAARKLVDEEKVDIIMGPTITQSSLALLEVIGSSKTPMISLAGSSIIVTPPEGNKAWSFMLAPAETSMGHYIFRHMAKTGKKTVAFIGFNDAFGDSFLGEMKKLAEKNNVKLLTDERFGRTDTSVTAQVLKAVSTNPDAIIIGASGTPSVAPILELRKLNYRGNIYGNQGMANSDFLRVGGAQLTGLMLPVSPVLVAEQLPDSNPTKGPGVEYLKVYEGKYGPNTRTLFGATAWDAYMILDKAAAIARKSASPGTPEFRSALRDAIVQTKDFVGSQGVFTMSEKDHNGTDLRAQVLVEIKNGKWTYVPVD